MMTCMVCAGRTHNCFTKTFDVLGLGTVQYERCADCGFVFSETHLSMSLAEWSELNRLYHQGYQGTQQNDEDPRWIERLLAQAQALVYLRRSGIIPRDSLSWLDFACGDRTLGRVLDDARVPIRSFDRYMGTVQSDFVQEDELVPEAYGLVFNTSYLEHIRSLEQIDEMMSLLAPSGVFAFHTGVFPVIPNDSTWFYLIPVHTAFYSNESMSRLFERYRFCYCLYHSESRMWFWFREGRDILSKLQHLLDTPDGGSFFVSERFVNPGRVLRFRSFLSAEQSRIKRFVSRSSKSLMRRVAP